ncbi:Riboflavin transporter FmnP [Marinitoga hydrogenitolerans DSM 16785]|uniref:Riboflavin transporter n=1 Tax=Marinitoga hydrogenitolerans (strain DSM 16785 / JCM 12826 / AT1271) TaxID=1122195 RepID=A0A1M4T4M8_MARH1|nr:ECF transporter S component [Marinitoga hydrogenitolerans]SHE39453.1 Riboflavin transporter FmnP [Marinitoga hydrogenitolerans DSM 16785]
MSRVKTLSTAGILGALSVLLMFLEFPIFPFASFLKFDPSALLIIASLFLFDWKTAMFSLITKDIVFYFVKSGDLIGVSMDFIAIFTFISILTIFKLNINKYIKYSISSFGVGIIMVLMNMAIIPIYFKMSFSEAAKYFGLSSWTLIITIIAFNMIKFIIDAILGDLLYKRIKNFFS